MFRRYPPRSAWAFPSPSFPGRGRRRRARACATTLAIAVGTAAISWACIGRTSPRWYGGGPRFDNVVVVAGAPSGRAGPGCRGHAVKERPGAQDGGPGRGPMTVVSAAGLRESGRRGRGGSTHGAGEQRVLATLPDILRRHGVDAVISGM